MPPTFLEAISLETLEANLFRGSTPQAEQFQRIYGGQVIAQALLAAYATVEGRLCHSLHCYFIRPGDPSIPIIYEVDRSRDGGSFTVRRVIAVQRGQQILNLAASFQAPERGLEHQLAVATVPPWQEVVARARLHKEDPGNWPLEFRPVDDPAIRDKPLRRSPDQKVWLRVTDAVPADPRLQQVALAYASDTLMLSTSIRPHGVDWGELQSASLDHAMWFHRPINANAWHLFDQVSPSASGGRGMNLAYVYSDDGTLVATCAQEGLIRRK